MDVLKMGQQLKDAVIAARFLYGEKWKALAEEIRRDILEPYRIQNVKTNHLAAAVEICSKPGTDPRKTLAYLAASVDTGDDLRL